MAAIARDSSKILGLIIGDCAIEPPGLYMPRVGPYKPHLSLHKISLVNKSTILQKPSRFRRFRLLVGASPPPAPFTRYVVVGMDFDAPYPSLPVFLFSGPCCHWIQADLVVVVASSSSDTAGVATPEVADGSFGGMHCAVLVPEPAAGECAAPVRVLPV
ncbi:hypothetical protein BM221_005557 [Beauveria bassiana]|uniref:Uncharacterized protein n=1 Tax=Beauveria bassiana TaxID=176275 RepID=A0A2N6NNW6_BEABA|nr:hypothetical protein BM221_005557 [Beauveria bassiana]